jgi:uncharacterized protein
MNTIAEAPLPSSGAPSPAAFLNAAQAACRRIAPLWPLQHFVAVNPFVGLTGKPFSEACELMQRLVPGGMQMPAEYYREKRARGRITDDDLESAIAHARETLPAHRTSSLAGWTAATAEKALGPAHGASGDDLILTVTEALDAHHGSAWSAAVVEAVGQFCAGYFDQGQSAWRFPWRDQPLFHAWREYAALDASFELLGLSGFRAWVKALPAEPEAALVSMLERFHLDAPALEDFLHKQLFTIRGWAGHIQYRVREHGMNGQADDSLLHLLAIRLAYDAALLDRHDSPEFREFWPSENSDEEAAQPMLSTLVWQFADEQAWQRELMQKLASARERHREERTLRPEVQAVFCIDVRSEPLRRALEAAAPVVETLGFAGFFGMPIEYVPFGKHQGGSHCPVLLKPRIRIRETLRHASEAENAEALRRQRLGRRIAFSWNSFKTSAISCFSFVETAGLAFGAKLFRDAFAPGEAVPICRTRFGPEIDEDAAHGFGIALEDRVALARGALKNMGLTHGFARLVLLCGHGSATANNPYGSGLDCGACGGHAGDANARVGAAILNDPEVRSALAAGGIEIPGETWFLAGLHNTTTDEVTLLDSDLVPASHAARLAELRAWLAAAGKAVRRERAASLGLKSADSRLEKRILARSRDWAEVRPEWGLAGNAAFIAAPRVRTKGAELGGRAFLHGYDHRADADGSTLELIMTAPMVVANWINLQYFASTANNAVFGSGNKVLHNVVGTLGVCQGNGGDLQTGLPLQSVHDGSRWMHEPLRLHAFLEAPREKIAAVLARHQSVRQLVEHGWLLLFAIEHEGRAIHRYLARGKWELVCGGATSAPAAAPAPCP